MNLSTNALTYLLAALAILFIVSVSAAVYAAARMWQIRERAREDLDPHYKPSTKR